LTEQQIWAPLTDRAGRPSEDFITAKNGYFP
jgi:hypothetical protein